MKWKFEYIFVFALLFVISLGFFFALYDHDKELTMLLFAPLSAALGAIMTFLFTKHQNPTADRREGDKVLTENKTTISNTGE